MTTSLYLKPRESDYIMFNENRFDFEKPYLYFPMHFVNKYKKNKSERVYLYLLSYNNSMSLLINKRRVWYFTNCTV